MALSALVAALVAAVDWKAVGKKLAGDAASSAAKAGQQSLLRHLSPSDREKAAKQAITLFTEEFLKELDDKSPLSAAIPGYHDQLKRLLEPAAVDIAFWFQPDLKTVDLASVARIWSGLKLDPLPQEFEWQLVAQNYGRAIRQYIKQDPELRQQFALALQEDSRSFDQRFAPGFDLAAYRDFLQKKCGMLQLSAMHASAYDRRISLWSVFVPQSVRESAPVPDIPRELQRQLRREGQIAGRQDDDDLAGLRESYRNSPVTGVFDVIARERSVVLLGDPGSGKTSLLKYLVLRWATEDHGPLPLWVDLKEYARQPLGLKPYLDSGAAFGLDARLVEDRLQTGQAALYLDGLDEIFHAPTRATTVGQIAAFSTRYPKASVVVTSRIIGYEPEQLRDFGFTHATLEDFDGGQIRDFLAKWHDVAEDDPKERLRLQAQLERALSDSPAIRELAGNPLLLTMMAILNRNQELPRIRVELYREAGRVLLHEWDAKRALLPTDTFDRHDKEELLRELAGDMQQNEGGLAGNLIERERLITVFRKFLAGLGIQDAYTKAESLVHQLTERNFILCPAGADRFAFVHRTFLEYFCADWFVQQFQKQRTLTFDHLKLKVFGRHWHDEKWHEVLRLIAGMVGVKQAGELILFLMGLDGRDQKLANLLLAAGCLGEVRSRRAILPIDQALLERLKQDAVRYDPPYFYYDSERWDEVGPTRTKAVGLIASVWRSADTRSWLLSMATQSGDVITKTAAIQELARGWKDDPGTLPFLKDCARSGKSYDVRSAALQELARGWKDDPETLPLLNDRARTDEQTLVRTAAVQELARGWKDSPATLPWLKDCALGDKDYSVRLAAIQELARGWKHDPGTLPLLKHCSRTDEEAFVRMAAVQELARGWKQDSDIRPLLRDLVRAKNPAVQSAAIGALARGWKDDPETLPWLKGTARTALSPSVRMTAVDEVARGWKNDPDTLPWLKQCAGASVKSDVRMAALQQLARHWKDDAETLPLLKNHACSDDNVGVRAMAVELLARGWKDDPETLALVQDRACSDRDRRVRVSAIRCLARTWNNHPGVLPLLKERARIDEDKEVRIVIDQELARG